VHELLGDIDPGVRFRAAQGLLAGKEKAAVPALVALVGDAPTGLAWKVEDMLRRVAGQHAPNASMGDGSLQARQKYRDAWAAWWRDHAQTVDLAGMDDGRHHLGFTLVAEMDSNKVWEFGLDGKPRWKVDHLQGPMDAQILPGDHVLIAEYQGRCVTERDQHGKIHWRKEINGSPITCQRLPNGNTFIATHNSFMEITPQGKELYSRTPGAGLFVFGAQKMANGNIACVANPGVIQEIDPVANKSVKSIRLDNNFGGWCGVEALPGGRFLIAVLGSGKVQELDSAGKAIWECTVPGACHATRLPNGHVLVACMANRRVVEVDREGKTIKETLTEGRPWRVHQR
jgi:hypothetical protein